MAENGVEEVKNLEKNLGMVTLLFNLQLDEQPGIPSVTHLESTGQVLELMT